MKSKNMATYTIKLDDNSNILLTNEKNETVSVLDLLKDHEPHRVFAFDGQMGAGKTTFIKKLCEEMGTLDVVNSPTFAIVNYYRGPRPLAHFDLYRISTENDLCAAGFYDYLDQGAVVAAEWSENFADLLALENPIRVNIDRLDDTTRKITIEGVTV